MKWQVRDRFYKRRKPVQIEEKEEEEEQGESEIERRLRRRFERNAAGLNYMNEMSFYF